MFETHTQSNYMWCNDFRRLYMSRALLQTKTQMKSQHTTALKTKLKKVNFLTFYNSISYCNRYSWFSLLFSSFPPVCKRINITRNINSNQKLKLKLPKGGECSLLLIYQTTPNYHRSLTLKHLSKHAFGVDHWRIFLKFI